MVKRQGEDMVDARLADWLLKKLGATVCQAATGFVTAAITSTVAVWYSATLTSLLSEFDIWWFRHQWPLATAGLMLVVLVFLFLLWKGGSATLVILAALSFLGVIAYGLLYYGFLSVPLHVKFTVYCYFVTQLCATALYVAAQVVRTVVLARAAQ